MAISHIAADQFKLSSAALPFLTMNLALTSIDFIKLLTRVVSANRVPVRLSAKEWHKFLIVQPFIVFGRTAQDARHS